MPDTCSCIKCTVTFGQNLANLVHTWYEVSSRTERELDQVLYDIQASTSALKHLVDLLEADKGQQDAEKKVFTPEACREVELLAVKCNVLFKALILLVQRAVERKVEIVDGDEAETDGEDKKKESDEEGKEQVDESGEKKTEAKEPKEPALLSGDVVDLNSMKALSLTARLNRKKWSWLEDRVTMCQEQLRWVRKVLLLHLQIAKFAQLQMGNDTRVEGSFESELVARLAIHGLQKSQLKYVKRFARKQEKAQRVRELQAKRKVEEEEKQKKKGDDDAVSIKSSSSNASAKTIVGDQSPVTKLHGEKSGILPPPAPSMSAPHPPPWVGPGGPPPLGMGIGMPVGPPALNNSSPMVDPTSPAPKQHDKKPSKVGASLSKLSETMSDWTERIFGKEDEFSKDTESQRLEAWVTRGTPDAYPMKVPFGHKRLQYGLKNINSAKLEVGGRATFARYVDCGPRMQIIIDDVVREANRMQRSERVCLSFKGFQRPQNPGNLSFAIVFFSIQEEKAPISFLDCVGRKMELPFQVCKTWEGMKETIDDAFWHILPLSQHVFCGHFDLQDTAKGVMIQRSFWDTTIQPGASIRMTMWPNLEAYPVPHSLGMRPSFQNPRGPSADERNREQRAHRMRMALNALEPPRPPHMLPFGGGGGGCGMPPPRWPPGHAPMRMGGGIPPPMPPMMPRVVDVRSRRSRSSRSSSTTASSSLYGDEYKMTAVEEKELTFIDFVAELEKIKEVGVVELLAKFTYVKDIESSKCFEWKNEWDSGSDSDSDSDSSTTSSSSGSTIIDD